MVPMGAGSLIAEEKSTFVNRLEEALNSSSNKALANLFKGELAAELQLRHRRLKIRFPDARWTLKPSRELVDGRSTLEVLITGSRKSQGQKYNFESKQILALRTINEKVVDQELLFEESILRTDKELIPITLQIPDAVLTGSRYDIDVLFDKPLGDSMLAAGLIDITSQQMFEDKNPAILLAPMHGGGLFKSVSAPLNPGRQTWAILLTHTDGIISVTKLVRVVASEEELAIN